jgi:hypothetical protein
MRQTFGFVFACLLFFSLSGPYALGRPAIRPPVVAGHSIEQIALSDEKITQYLAAAPALTAILAKVGKVPAQEPDPHLLADLNATARHYGFADYTDYGLVADNIVWILTGIDPLSGKFIGITAVTREQAAMVVADKSLSAKEHKRRIEILHAQILTAAPVKFADNVSLVTKYYDQLLTLKQD